MKTILQIIGIGAVVIGVLLAIFMGSFLGGESARGKGRSRPEYRGPMPRPIVLIGAGLALLYITTVVEF